VIESSPIIVLDGPASTGSDKIVSFDLDVLGEPVYLRIVVKDQQAGLADIVPAARILASKIVQTTTDRLRAFGASVPCHKGCALCCKYLISVSVPEAFQLAEEAMMMPVEQRRHMVGSCSSVNRQLHEFMSKCVGRNGDEQTGRIDGQRLRQLSAWHFEQQIPCPFLCDNVCTIYEQRPVVCREHLVVGPTVPCGTGQTDTEQRIGVPIRPIRMRDALKILASDLEGTIEESILLPSVFDWCRVNHIRHERTWSAVTIAERLIAIVRSMIAANNTIQTEPAKHETEHSPGREVLDLRAQNVPRRSPRAVAAHGSSGQGRSDWQRTR